jgi:hypothetical protein
VFVDVFVRVEVPVEFAAKRRARGIRQTDDLGSPRFVDEHIFPLAVGIAADDVVDGADVASLKVGEAVRPIVHPFTYMQRLQAFDALAQRFGKALIGTVTAREAHAHGFGVDG